MSEDNDTIDVRHLCPLPHRGHAPHIDPPATMCHTHTQQLRDRITDITRWWDDIDALASAAGTSGHGGHGLNSKPPVRLDILALTDMHTHDGGDIPPAAAILTSTANWIARARRLTPIAGPRAALGLLRVHGLALGDHPNPQAVHGRLSRVWFYLRRQVGESRHVLATCQQPHPDPQNDDECGGPITWTGRSIGAIAVCGRCHDEWTDSLVDFYWAQKRLADEREQAGTA